MLKYTCFLKNFEKLRKCGKKKSEVLKSCTYKLKKRLKTKS